MHRTILATVTAASVVIATSVPALAGKPLLTLPAYVGGSHTASCKVYNATDKPISIGVELISASGGEVLDTLGTVVLEGGAYATTSGVSPGQAVLCRFTGASKTKVRAAMTVWGSHMDATDETVVPAQ